MAETLRDTGNAGRRAELAHRYSLIAIDLFAERGYRSVTVAEVAAASGVTSRTMFRYFSSKEELLLFGARHATAMLLDALRSLPKSADPVGAVWALLVELTLEHRATREPMVAWARAARDAPEVLTRMRGERAAAIQATLTELFGEWLDLDPTTDVRPCVLAASLYAAEQAVLDHYVRHPERQDLAELFRVAFAGVRGLTATLERSPVLTLVPPTHA